MAYRSKSYTYSGGDVIFPIPFDYIKENDIYVFINGKSTTDFIIENHQVKLTVIPSELPATILIKSQTDITSAVTKWQDTSLLDDLNLTLSNNQLLYSTQELYDAFDDFSTDLKNETNQQILDFKEEVNETIQEVSDAAEKINELETAVEDAKKAAITAESKATDAALQASNATTQAQLAQQAAQEAEAAVNEIESLSIADKDLSNITEAGKDVIRNTAGSGFSLFDVVEKDHILSFEESMGFGLLGTYVYKDAVPGARYGYPDFYNECVAQKEAGTEETITVGDVSFTATKNPNGHIFYDIADKATVDEIFSQRGEAWFYGVDTENERVFLPRGTRSQYTVNTDETGDYVEARLPNITGTMTADISEGVATGALKIDTIYPGAMWSGNTNVARMRNWSLDASLSNPIYGNSDTVQPYATKKLLYIVVGNVKVQSAASDVVDVTTTENDTLPLFYNFYAKDEDMADAVSFVKSTGTFLGGNLYPTAYEKLVARVGTGNVKAHTDDYTDYDFVVNQDEMTFRLPLKNGKEVLPGNETVNTLGFSANPTNNVEEYIVPYNGYITIIGYKQSTANTLNVMLNGVIVSQTRALVGGLSSESYFFAKKGDRVTVFTDSASTGWAIATQTITKAIGDGNLYYKVLNAVVNQELVDFAHIQTELNTKLSRSNKEEIVSWGMPDYTAQSTFTLPAVGQTFTVPYDCLLSIHLIAQGGGSVQLRLNNASGAIIVEAASATNQVETQTNVYLKKGWKIYTNSLTSIQKCLITPLIDTIGANQ
jgi:hypothetical protein